MAVMTKQIKRKNSSKITNQNSNNMIAINNFTGPLDLLLELVKTKKVSLLNINLVEITSEYLKITNQLINDYNLELMSEYLLIAATLINLKANMILKPPQEQTKLQVAKKTLLNRLFIYQQFKNIAQKLRNYENQMANMQTKKPHSPKQYRLEIDETSLVGASNPVKLVTAFRQLLERTRAAKIKQTMIDPLNLSPVERRLQILKMIEQTNEPLWSEICQVPTMNHFALTWITLLNMANKQEIFLRQETLFGNILISKINKEDNDE